MTDLGRIFVFLGIVLVAVGLLLLAFSRIGFPLGRLPGDFNWKGSNWSASFPLMTSILFSVVISLILWIINHFRR